MLMTNTDVKPANRTLMWTRLHKQVFCGIITGFLVAFIAVGGKNMDFSVTQNDVSVGTLHFNLTKPFLNIFI